MATPYSDCHKAFLQNILKHRIMSESQAKLCHENICKKYNVNNQDLKEFINLININLQVSQMAIRISIQENHEEDIHCYVLVNNLNNEMTKQYSSFSKVELEFVKKLIYDIVQDTSGKLRVTTILNESKMSISITNNLIDRLKQEQWILESKGYVSLGALTICELQNYIENNFEEEISKCYFCKEYTFLGRNCPECDVAGHRSCLRKFWARINKGYRCPTKGCTAVWNDPNEPRKRIRVQSFEDSEESD